MRELLFLRHGQTENNEQRRFTGSQDIPLSPAGREALLARRHLYPRAERFFTSGMLRARQTLDILYGGVPSVDIPDLGEYRMGVFENRTHDELEAENDPLYREWLRRERKDLAPPGGESRADFEARVLRGLRTLYDHPWDGLAVLVSHGGVVSTALGLLYPAYDYAVHRTGNGLGWRIEMDGELRVVSCEAFK